MEFRLVLRATSLLVVGTVGAASAAPPPASEISNPDITAAEVRAHVRYLASDELQGRGSGTSGNDRAADYIASRFKAAGLKPLGDSGAYFQKFSVFTGMKLGPVNRLVTQRGGITVEHKVTDDFMPLSFSANGNVVGPIAFAGYGISAPDLKYDDYAGLDVRGKIVVVLRFTPDGEENGKFGPYAGLVSKIATARDKGAAGVLLVRGPLNADPGAPSNKDAGGQKLPGAGKFPSLSRASSSSDAGIPAAFLDLPVLEQLLKPLDKNVKDLQVQLAHGQPQSFVLQGVRGTFRVDIGREMNPTRNVLGFLEGSDPALKNEVVVVGAHYDHLGLGDEHSLSGSSVPAIHHGADDNASGTAGVIELAQYFGANRAKARRSILFMAFSGEEMGLLGSAHWTKNPTLPVKRIAAMVNLDMIGRMTNDTVQVIMADTSPAWKSILDTANTGVGLKLQTGGQSDFGGSDHQSFYNLGVPVLFFFTGVHPDYHRPSDTWEKVNADGEARILKVVSSAVAQTAAMDARPVFVKLQEKPQQVTPGFRVSLGTIPEYSANVVGVQLQGVREGSAAAVAGLKGGDVLVELAGKSIRNVEEYTAVLGTLKAGVAVDVVVNRAGKRMKMSITPRARGNQ